MLGVSRWGVGWLVGVWVDRVGGGEDEGCGKKKRGEGFGDVHFCSAVVVVVREVSNASRK